MIKASSSSEIRALIDALGTDDEVERDVAVARLRIIGARAVDRLIAVYAKSQDRRTHTAILRALEAIGDHRSLAPARQALSEGGDVAIAATGVLRSLLGSSNAPIAAAALDALVAATLDAARERSLRLAAFEALQEMPAQVRAPIADALRRDLGSVLGAGGDAGEPGVHAEALWTDAVEGRLPDGPEALRDALVTRGATAPLSNLRTLIDLVRTREANADASARAVWLALRGALHQALALRGSRVALYDLRETVGERPPRLPATFLASLHVLGDASCLEPLAAAWEAADADRSADGLRYRQQLAAAFRAIVARERITKRHAALKRVSARWPGIVGPSA